MIKTIIITGASSGIGYALAQWLAKSEHQVIAVARSKEALQQLQASYPANIKSVVADITQEEDRFKIKQALQPAQQGIYLVHNAGVATPCLLENLSEQIWDHHDFVNTKAPLFLTQLLLPHLKNGGRVLHISTGLAHKPLPGMLAYAMTKAAFYMLKEQCNVELNDQDIAFGSAMPGVVDTPIQTNIRNYDVSEFPAVDLFQGFQKHNELLSPMTAAKFLAWLLLETKQEEFIKGDWNIYDSSHQSHWAAPGEVKQR
jgi:NADP-dependent 3-hydroxy acid dehydrogenase YdfG